MKIMNLKMVHMMILQFRFALHVWDLLKRLRYLLKKKKKIM